MRWNQFIFVRAGLVNFAQAHVVGGVGRRMSGQNGVFLRAGWARIHCRIGFARFGI